MAGLLLPSVVALAFALVRGGSIGNWSRARVLGWPLGVGVLAFELVLYNPPVDREPWAMWIGPWLWLATRLLLSGVLIGNALRTQPGVWAWRIAACGMLLNTLVIAANGGHMPQSAAAAASVWGARTSASNAHLDNTTPMTPDTRFPVLGDVIAEPGWLPHPNVVSVGDLMLALGVAVWLFRVSAAQRSSAGGDIVGTIGSPAYGAAPLDRQPPN